MQYCTWVDGFFSYNKRIIQLSDGLTVNLEDNTLSGWPRTSGFGNQNLNCMGFTAGMNDKVGGLTNYDCGGNGIAGYICECVEY